MRWQRPRRAASRRCCSSQRCSLPRPRRSPRHVVRNVSLLLQRCSLKELPSALEASRTRLWDSSFVHGTTARSRSETSGTKIPRFLPSTSPPRTRRGSFATSLVLNYFESRLEERCLLGSLSWMNARDVSAASAARVHCSVITRRAVRTCKEDLSDETELDGEGGATRVL